MAENKNNISLVDKYNLAKLNRTGQMPKNESEKAQDKVFVVRKKSDEKNDKQSTLPNQEFNVLFVNDANTRQTFYSANEVKKYDDLRKAGKMPEGFSIRQEPVGEYIQKQFSTYKIGFEKAIQSDGNEDIPVVLSYIIKAQENNDQVSLGKMADSLSGRDNYKFIFRGGRLDLPKIKEIADSKETVENTANLEIEEQQLESDVERTNESPTTKPSRLGKIVSAVLARIGALTITARANVEKDNNSLENLFERSSLQANDNNAKTNEVAELENRARLEREKLTKERELERAKARDAAGKKLSPEQQRLLDEDRAERARVANEKMEQSRTIGQYELSNEEIAKVNAAGVEFAKRKKESIITVDKTQDENAR